MKILFEPYVLEPFTDFYKFPHESNPENEHKQLIHRYFQMDLAALQHNYREELEDRRRIHQQRIAELHRNLARELKDAE